MSESTSIFHTPAVDASKAALAAPKPGMVFHEMYSAWYCVLEASPLRVTALEWWGQPPEHPEAKATVWSGTPVEFRHRMRGNLVLDKPHPRLAELTEFAAKLESRDE